MYFSLLSLPCLHLSGEKKHEDSEDVDVDDTCHDITNLTASKEDSKTIAFEYASMNPLKVMSCLL